MSTRTATFTASSGSSLTSYAVTNEPRFHKHPLFAISAALISTGGRVYCSASSTTAGSIFFDDTVLTSADYSVSLTIRCLSSVPSVGYMGVIGRADSKVGTFYLAIYDFATSKWELYSSDAGGTITGIGTAFSQTLSADTDYVLKLSMTGTSIALSVDGVSRVTATNSSVTAIGRGGLAMFRQQADTTGVQGDTFTVEGTFATYQIICDGDSLTIGSGYGASGVNPYPTQLGALLGSSYAIVNLGVAGQTASDMSSDAATQVDGLLSTSVTKNILVAWGGTNDIYFGASAATAISNYSGYASARQSAGWNDVLIIDMLPRTGGSPPVDLETSRGTFNASLAANHTYSNDLYQASGDSRIGDAGDDSDTTYYYTDHTHLNNTGYGIIAAGAKNLIVPRVAASGVTASAPASHTAGSASGNGTVTIATGATFTGLQTVTITSNNSGDTITPSVGSPGTTAVTVTPAKGATSFTFTVTRSTAGTSTLTYTNAQGWTNPATTDFVATAVLPTLSSPTITADGLHLTATFSTSGMTPSSGSDAGGFSFNLFGATPNVTAWAISGTTLTLTFDEKVNSDAHGTYSYDAGTGTFADGSGNAMASFSTVAVTNNSTQTASQVLFPISFPTGGANVIFAVSSLVTSPVAG